MAAIFRQPGGSAQVPDRQSLSGCARDGFARYGRDDQAGRARCAADGRCPRLWRSISAQSAVPVLRNRGRIQANSIPAGAGQPVDSEPKPGIQRTEAGRIAGSGNFDRGPGDAEGKKVDMVDSGCESDQTPSPQPSPTEKWERVTDSAPSPTF